MRDSLAKLYEDLDAEIARRGWTCRACGACCEFERSGQILFCTSIEADYLADGGDVPDGVSDQTCPFLVDDKCMRRDRRTICCRTFYCQMAGTGEMESLTEEYLKRLKRLHVTNRVEWKYARLAEHLNGRKPLLHKK